jgi:aspartate-semialdehyde dehydrogenase
MKQPSDTREPVAVLGATGLVGQRLVERLVDHPLFRVVSVSASDARRGQRYGDNVAWDSDRKLPTWLADMPLVSLETRLPCRWVFSALDSGTAAQVERGLALAGHMLVTNAANHRMDLDVPLLIPEVNPDHLELVRQQAFHGGGLIANPNCTAAALALALHPLRAAFGLRRVLVATYQSVSGAGKRSLQELDLEDNLIPWISGEQVKVARETAKILGQRTADSVRPHDVLISAQCVRVPVLQGHSLAVSVELEQDPSDLEGLISAWERFRGEPQRLGLPSAPEAPLRYHRATDAPQPRLHRDLGAGMTVSIGRLEPCPVLGYRFFCVSHNLWRGAAGGALLCAELALRRGL